MCDVCGEVFHQRSIGRSKGDLAIIDTNTHISLRHDAGISACSMSAITVADAW